MAPLRGREGGTEGKEFKQEFKLIEGDVGNVFEDYILGITWYELELFKVFINSLKNRISSALLR